MAFSQLAGLCPNFPFYEVTGSAGLDSSSELIISAAILLPNAVSPSLFANLGHSVWTNHT
jgi:hypothetical protein